MTEKLIKKNRWFWPWQDEQEESWLSELARQGLHLQKPDIFGTYTFRTAEPCEVVYRLDFTRLKKTERENYWQLFQDAGWEHVGEMSGWQYFRRPVRPGESAEIFSDNESKIQKYKRLLTQMTAMLPVLIMLYVAVNQSNSGSFWIMLGSLLYIGLMVIYGISMVKINDRIKTLKQL